MNKTVRIYALFLSLLMAMTACPIVKENGQQEIPIISQEEHDRKEVVIFIYHRFDDARYPSTNIPAEIFERHLQYLHDSKFTVMTFGEAVDYINKTSIPAKEKVACITVDDGYKTFYLHALPLLKRFNYKATVFINTESVGGNSYMNWEELKSAHEQGIELGNHSHSHAYFLNKPEDQRLPFFLEDIRMCQDLIVDNLGFSPDVFAYPYGEFTPDLKKVLKEEGFKAAAAQNSGVYISGDNFAIPRFPMAGPYTKMEGFTEKANMHALRIHSQRPESFLLQGDNPPLLELILDSTAADLTRINCFTASPCTTSLVENKLSIRAKSPLKARRTLYTITAPSRDSGGWHWYSHLWIRPEVAE